MPSRRDVLRLLALGGGGLAQACSSTRPQILTPPRPRLVLPPVHVAPDREIRTVVGLRPFRPAGFVVRADKLGGKLLVHNYGHGGAGVTLSWGTADLAARLALAADEKRIAVLGCGAVGLATARLLEERGASVTLYAASLPPETTSNIAGAQWFPFTVYDRGALVPPFREQFIAACEFSYRRFQALVGETWGVRWMANYWCANEPPHENGLVGAESPIRHLLPEYQALAPDEHSFPYRHVRRFDTMMIEPDVYLPALVRDVRLAGAAVVVRRFDTIDQVAALPEPVLVNCTGLGAGALFSDPDLVPVKGQLTVLLPQPEVTYAILAGDLYMFSRRDGVLLGGTHERGATSLEPDLEAKARILDGHAQLFRALSGA